MQRQQKVLLAAFLTVLGFSAARFVFPVLLKPLAADLGVSRGVVSGLFSLGLIVYSVTTVFTSSLADRWGTRAVIGGAAVLVGLGLLLTASAGALWQAFLFYGLLFGIGLSVLYTVPMTQVRRAFGERSGLALGVPSSAVAIGTFGSQILGAWLLLQFGSWRVALGVAGLVCVALVLPFAGWLETGSGSPLAPGPAAGAQGSRTLSPWGALRRTWHEQPRALAYALAYGLGGCGYFVGTLHFVAFATDHGISPALAALMSGAVGVSSIPGRLLAGGLADRFGDRRQVILISLLLELAGMLTIAFLHSVLALWAFAILFGLGQGGWTSQFPGLLGDDFGTRQLTFLFAVSTALWGLLGAAGGGLAGLLYDLAGSYRWAFLGSAATFVGALGLLGLRQPRARLYHSA